MIKSKKVKNEGTIIGKLGYGSDLLEELTSFCIKNDISLGKVEAIGAVQKACIGFYNQKDREYQYINYNSPAEILNLTGNISLKEGKAFVHAHIILSDEKGNALGGHLSPGTITFACEFIIHVFSGEKLCRMPDKETGLPLWNL